MTDVIVWYSTSFMSEGILLFLITPLSVVCL